MKHEFIETGDADSRKSIEDSNGEVVLAQCRVCRQAEGELEAECPGRAPVTTEAAVEKAKARKTHPRITMGQVAAILGVSKTMKREAVLREMVRTYHGAESEYVSNIAADWNEEHRATATVVFEDHFKRNVTTCDTKHKTLSSTAHTVNGKAGKGLAFIRTPFGQRDAVSSDDFKPLEDQPHMYAQMQVEMHLAEVEWGCFFQWAPMANTFQMVKIDPAFIERTIKQLDDFYAEYKEATKDKSHLEPLRKNHNGKDLQKLVEEYDGLTDQIGNAKSRQDEILAVFKEKADGKSCLIAGRKLSVVSKQGSIQYANVVKEHLPKLDLEPYRGKPSKAWSFEK